MKKISALVLTILGVMTIFSLLVAGYATAKPLTLKYWTHDSPNSYRVKEVYNVFAQKVKEATDGQVVIEIHAMSPVTSPKEAHDAVAAGVVDIAMCITGVSPGRYPILDAINLPALGLTSAEMSSLCVFDLVEKYPIIEQKMGNVKIVEVAAAGMDMIGLGKKAVRSIEDFKGLKLRSAGDHPTRHLKAMGAIPVMMGPGDIYPNVQKGVIDGYNLSWGGVLIFKLAEVTKYCLESRNWTGPFFSVINRDKWNALSPEHQTQIVKLSNREWSRYIGQTTDKQENLAREAVKKAGAEIIVPSPELREQMQNYSKPLWEEYVTALESKGLPGKKVVNDLLSFVENYKKPQ